jgi:hypothetical protein
MLEAVSTVLKSSSFVRANAEQTSNATSLAANPDRVQQAAPQAPFVSPYISFDVNFDRAVLQLRDGDTGDVRGQFPSQAQLEAQARATTSQGQVRVEVQSSTNDAPTNANVQAQQAAQSAPAPQQAQQTQQTQQQQAAFTSAVQAGNSNAGSVSLLA